MSTNVSKPNEAGEPAKQTSFSDSEAGYQNEDEKIDQVIITDQTTLGSYLHQARKQEGLSLQQAANTLFLNIRYLRAIENDDYSDLPSAVFVRGYLRNYAKLLGLSAETVLKAYDAMATQNQPPKVSSPLKQEKQVNTGSPWFKMLTGIILLALIVFVILGYIFPDPPIETEEDIRTSTPENLLPPALPELLDEEETVYVPPPEEGDTETSDPIGDNAVSATDQLVIHIKETTILKITDSEGKILHAGEAKAQAVLSLVGKPPFEVVADTPHVAIEYLDKTADLTTYKQKSQDTYEISATTPVETTEETTVTQTDAALTIHFKEKAWLRITDSTKKLYEGTKNTGQKLTVEGTPPFKIRAGNVAGIEVEYAEKTVNLTDHTEKEGNLFVFGN